MRHNDMEEVIIHATPIAATATVRPGWAAFKPGEINRDAEPWHPNREKTIRHTDVLVNLPTNLLN
jgi:hypothetical protein